VPDDDGTRVIEGLTAFASGTSLLCLASNMWKTQVIEGDHAMDIKKALTLILTVTTVLVLAACAGILPGSADPLEGTSWALVTLGGAGLIPGTEITLNFEKGEVRGSAGCNTYGGGYRLDGDKITMTDLYNTEMACMDPPGVMDQEMEYLALLRDALSFQVEGSQLSIEASSGEVLVFVGG
jgi:heat shock protein HslJ